jgi:hypothetical protein
MQLLKKLTTLLLFIGLFQPVFGQTKTAETIVYKHELGLNVTNLLTDLLGNNNRTDAGVYLLSYKFVNNNKAIRVGLGVNLNFKKENSFGSELMLTNQNFQLRIGQEKRHSLSSKFQYYTGFDGIVGYKLEESSASVATGTVIQSDKLLTIGTGPVLGFQFALYERLLIGTEGSLYAAYNISTVDFRSGIATTGKPAILPPNKDAKIFTMQTNLPKFLFIILKF